jgi:transposase-like protein
MKDTRVKRGQSPAMDKAQALIESGKSVADAAKKSGVQAQSIYRRQWYKAIIAAKASK